MKHKLINLTAGSVKMDGEGYKFTGYASVFNGIDSYGDMIAPGAYRNTLAARERAVQMRWNHYGPVIGKWLSISEDDRGLKVEGELTPGHSVAEDAKALLNHGAVSGLSIGYRVLKQEQQSGYLLLKEIELIEISVVEEPADNAARISDIKAAIYGAETYKEFESILREAGGFSGSDATALVAGIKSLSHGERVAKQIASITAADRLQSIISKLGV
jgi:HK97 family phage prohead protease